MDNKTRLMQDIIEELSSVMNAEQLGIVNEVMVKVLAEYEIQAKSTQLTVYDNKNERLLKRYSACLSVDGKSEKTIKLYISRLKAFSDFMGLPYDEIGTYDIRFYLASMKEQGVSNRTLENYRSYISAFYQWLTNEDFISKNPCDKILPIKYKEEIRNPFSETEIDLLRTACRNERDRAIMEVLLSSGLRAAELTSLDTSDVDFNSLSIHIREGKGSKERWTYMTSVCAMHLRAYLMTRADSNPSLFISFKRKERFTTSGVRKLLKEVGRISNISDVHPHRFRRTFATNLAKRGMDVQTIAKLMGHSNIQTTMIYVTLDDSQVLSEYKKHTA